MFLTGHSQKRMQVHIQDLTDFYVDLFGRVLKLGDKAVGGSPYSRYYIISKESLPAATVQASIAAELHKRGLLPSVDVVALSFEQLGPLAKCVYSFLPLRAAC